MAFRVAPLSSGRIFPRTTTRRATPFIPRARPSANTRYRRLFKATSAYTTACTDAGAALAPLLSGGTRVCQWQSAQRIWPDTRRMQLPLDDCYRQVLPYNAVHSIQQAEQIPNDPPRMGAKSTTTGNHPSSPAAPRTVRVKIFKKAVDPQHINSICIWIQMNRKELTKTFKMLLN